MGSLSDAGPEQLRLLSQAVRERAAGARTLDAAAQILTDEFYDRFGDSTVLIRVFVTIPFRATPAAVQQFVRGLIANHPSIPPLRDDTTILALMGTRGALPAWNSRLKSKGHLGIPLASPEFVGAIPMVSRLLSELGVSIEGTGGSEQYVSRVIGNLSGVFHVADARTARDAERRPIIAAQDFVAAHDVRSVFGFGGAYMLERSFAVVIVFTRETIAKEQAERFAPLASAFKTATMAVAAEGRFFS